MLTRPTGERAWLAIFHRCAASCKHNGARTFAYKWLDRVAVVRNRRTTMAFMLFMVEPVGQRQERTEAEGREAYAKMVRWGESLQKRGLLLAVESLQSHAKARRVQVRGGRPYITDGPFSEAKEMIGGYFLVDCATLEQAVALAKECPAAEWLTVEVRGLAACFEESLSA